MTCGLPSVRAACQAGCHIQELLSCISAGTEDCSFCPAWWLEWPFFEHTVSLSMSSSPVHHCALKQLLKPLPKSSQTGRILPSGEICPENTSSSVFHENCKLIKINQLAIFHPVISRDISDLLYAV